MAPKLKPGTLCGYSAMHAHRGILATTVIDCGPVGPVPACAQCAAFYAKR